MTSDQLFETLDLHAKWLRNDEGGKRANLADADLAHANLAGAYLARANLAGANLADADLAGANLAGAYLARANLAHANLAGAYLAGANLARANLAGAYLAGAYLAGASGIVLLTETDHGYRVYATRRDGVWRIGAGCRDFTIAEARAHWGASDYHLPLTGRRIIACIDWLEREIAAGEIK